MRKDADERACGGWVLGLVENAAPLVIRCGTLALTGRDLLINCQLLTHAQTTALSGITGALTATTDCGAGSITSIQTTDGALTAAGIFGGVLYSGCQVALMPSGDGQQYLVLCRVVGV